jgi:hypothetical protein
MIHAVTVSVNYADYLWHTLPALVRIADKVTVITLATDTEARGLATKYSAEVHLTGQLKGNFRKGKAIREALSRADNDWLLHVDADIGILQQIDTTELCKNTLYGAHRYSISGEFQWELIKGVPTCWRKMSPCPQDEPFTSVRFRRKSRTSKVLPPGYFQLWHSSQGKTYPSRSIDASLDDILHAERFKSTAILPNFGVYHLESKDHDLKANWQGRTTGRF